MTPITDYANMSFARALLSLYLGSAIARADWFGGRIELSHDKQKIMRRGAWGGKVAEWEPTSADILARDWLRCAPITRAGEALDGSAKSG